MKRIALISALFMFFVSFITPLAAESTLPSLSPTIKKIVPAVVRIEIFAMELEQNSRLDPYPMLPKDSPLRDLLKEKAKKEKSGQEKKQNNKASRVRVSFGSGFVIDGDGYIVTNYHVVENAEHIEVVLENEARLKAIVIGTDNITDIALLKADIGFGNAVEPVAFGNSESVEIGDWVIVIGNPFGIGISTSVGVVSAKRRQIDLGPVDFIQTDASINRGNSGGPLFNTNGEVIGINTAIFSPTGTSAGIGFANPSNLVQAVVEELREYGRIRRKWVGIKIQPETETDEERSGVRTVGNGIRVTEVIPQSPAYEAGIKPQDIIVSFNGKGVREFRDLVRELYMVHIEQTVRAKVVRDGRELELRIKIKELLTSN